MPNSPLRSSRLLLINAALPISFRIIVVIVPLPPRIFPYISIHRAYRLVPSKQYPIHRDNNSAHTGSPSPHSLTACSHRGHANSSEKLTGSTAGSNQFLGRCIVFPVSALNSMSANAIVVCGEKSPSGLPIQHGTTSASILTSASSARATPSIFCLSGLYRSRATPFLVGFSQTASSRQTQIRSFRRSSSSTAQRCSRQTHQSFRQRYTPESRNFSCITRRATFVGSTELSGSCLQSMLSPLRNELEAQPYIVP